jgi:hypothetical protein
MHRRVRYKSSVVLAKGLKKQNKTMKQQQQPKTKQSKAGFDWLAL